MSVTITPKEFATILDLAANAPAKIGEGFSLAGLLTRGVALANQPHPIGAIVPEEARPAPSVADSAT